MKPSLRVPSTARSINQFIGHDTSILRGARYIARGLKALAIVHVSVRNHFDRDLGKADVTDHLQSGKERPAGLD
jgi:hypothetical protein